MDIDTAARSEVCDFEHETGCEREEIPRALSMTRDVWIEATQQDYWSEIPRMERARLAGRLWDRIQRLASTEKC